MLREAVLVDNVWRAVRPFPILGFRLFAYTDDAGIEHVAMPAGVRLVDTRLVVDANASVAREYRDHVAGNAD